MTGEELVQKVQQMNNKEISAAIANEGKPDQADADLAPTPIFTKDGKFFFYDETWANALGPFDTREQAQAELQKYAESLG